MKINNKSKAEYILSHWRLRDGVVYSKITDKPLTFISKNRNGHRFQGVKINGKTTAISIHEAVFVLFHRRPVTEGKQLHHIDQNPQNNTPANLIELSPSQHKHIHFFMNNDPLRGIRPNHGAWRYQWNDNDGVHRARSFHGINEAMTFRDQIEAPRRAELRALGLNCKRCGNRITENTMRKISRPARVGLWRYR